MIRYSHLGVALALILGPGLTLGIWTGRFVHSDEPGASGARLENLPLDFGEWHGADLTIDKGSLAIGEIVNYKDRRYINLRTRSDFSALVVCGRPGPISVHTPESCFPGSGYSMVGSPTSVYLNLGDDLPAAEFKTARFRKQGANEVQEIQTFWAWTTDGNWQAPNYPRWTFGGSPALYKVYITRAATDKESVEERLLTAKTFMVELTKVIRKK